MFCELFAIRRGRLPMWGFLGACFLILSQESGKKRQHLVNSRAMGVWWDIYGNLRNWMGIRGRLHNRCNHINSKVLHLLRSGKVFSKTCLPKVLVRFRWTFWCEILLELFIMRKRRTIQIILGRLRMILCYCKTFSVPQIWGSRNLHLLS